MSDTNATDTNAASVIGGKSPKMSFGAPAPGIALIGKLVSDTNAADTNAAPAIPVRVAPR